MKGLFGKKDKGSNVKNPFASKKVNYGGGTTLGGSKPGKLICVVLTEPGPIGVKLENTSKGAAIIADVTPGSQAAEADMKRGDVICFAESNGQEEIAYAQFLAMCRSSQRPLVFDVRRVEGNTSGGSGQRTRADDYAKRQAVIAAAEARDKSNKIKSKPIARTKGGKVVKELTDAEKRKIEEQREEMARKNAVAMADLGPQSEEARIAILEAKNLEVDHMNELGYNPYEASKSTAGQAATATVTMNHGTFDAGKAVMATQNSQVTEKERGDKSKKNSPAVSESFDAAFTIVVTTNQEENVKKSLRIMRKLIQNAISDEKKRKVRITNPNKHIEAAVIDMNGALELMLNVGFILSEDEVDGETYLIYSSNDETPSWVSTALEQMEEYELKT